jgi:hypothetical protein
VDKSSDVKGLRIPGGAELGMEIALATQRICIYYYKIKCVMWPETTFEPTWYIFRASASCIPAPNALDLTLPRSCDEPATFCLPPVQFILFIVEKNAENFAKITWKGRGSII